MEEEEEEEDEDEDEEDSFWADDVKLEASIGSATADCHNFVVYSDFRRINGLEGSMVLASVVLQEDPTLHLLVG